MKSILKLLRNSEPSSILCSVTACFWVCLSSGTGSFGTCLNPLWSWGTASHFMQLSEVLSLNYEYWWYSPSSIENSISIYSANCPSFLADLKNRQMSALGLDTITQMSISLGFSLHAPNIYSIWQGLHTQYYRKHHIHTTFAHQLFLPFTHLRIILRLIVFTLNFFHFTNIRRPSNKN